MSALPISELFSGAPRSVIKGVQRGLINMTSSGAVSSVSFTATIAPVDLSKAVLTLLGATGHVYMSGGGGGENYTPYLELIDAQTVRVTRRANPNSHPQLMVSFQVVEFY